MSCVPGTARILKGEYISCYRYITSPRPSLMEAKGVAVWQPSAGDDIRGESRPAEAGYRKRMSLRLRLRRHKRGDEQEPSQAGLVGRVRNTG